MWNYEKRLQFPIDIKTPNAEIAKIIITQYGGPDGELGASMRYLSQRYTIPYKEVAGLLTDIGTEELAHFEMIGAIVYQLTKNLSTEEIEKQGFSPYYVDHTLALWPQAAGGIPFNACEFQSKGDIITDLTEDLAAEQKARTTYDNILRLVKDPEVCAPIRFLRAREIVHFQRFGEALRRVQENLDPVNFYQYNPEFDTNPNPRKCYRVEDEIAVGVVLHTSICINNRKHRVIEVLEKRRANDNAEKLDSILRDVVTEPKMQNLGGIERNRNTENQQQED